MRGKKPEMVRSMVKKSMLSRPPDDVAGFAFDLEYARTYGMAGMAVEATEMLESILQPPSETSVFKVELDPAFDGVRDDPGFMAMMERHK